MKRVFEVLVLLMLPLVPIHAQGLHGRILVLRDTSSYVPHDLSKEVPLIYQGQIDSLFRLPTDLSRYDAVLIQLNSVNSGDNDTLSVSEQLALIDYLKTGGKLYLESPSFPFLASSDNPINPDLPEDTLLHFLGLSSEAGDALVARYSEFFGVDSEFTTGLNVPHDDGDPTEDDLLESYIPIGSFIPVLYGDQDIFAWIPRETSLRAVVQYHPAFDYGHKAEYFAPFLTRVLCDYFGLCTDAVEVQKPAPSATLRMVSDGTETWLDVEDRETGDLDIENALGISVFHCKTAAGGARVQVPDALPSGFYFALLRTDGSSEMLPFPFVQK